MTLLLLLYVLGKLVEIPMWVWVLAWLRFTLALLLGILAEALNN